jgi:nitroreductase
MNVFEAIWTTRAMRRLDPTREVPETELLLVLAAATKGPSGGNWQPARWIVVRDVELRRRLGEVYRAIARPRLIRKFGALAEGDESVARMLSSALHLADHLAEAPVIVVPCAPADQVRVEGSVYPAVQNLMLAARARGLGTALTTMHREDEVTVRAVLNIPADIRTFALIPVGYPLGRWGEAVRTPVREVTYWDRWGTLRDDLPERIDPPAS